MSQGLQARAQPVWYVRAQGRVWGPYPDDRIEAFVQEGRVAAATLIAEAPDGPFRAVSEYGAFLHLFAQAEPQTLRVAEPTAQSHEVETVERAGVERPLLVFAMLTTIEETAFEAALTIHGPYERVGQGLWLLRARLGPAALRNALSRRLRGGDTLLVVEAPLNQAAWFNLDRAPSPSLSHCRSI